MKIILDNKIFSLQNSGGISVYWYEFIKRLLTDKSVNNLFVEDNNDFDNIFRNKIEIENQKIIFSKKFYYTRYSPVYLNISHTKFIFHSSYYRILSKKTKKNNNAKEVVTVHDFTYELFRKGFAKWLHSYQKKKAIKSADIVICISENTKKDLLHFYPEFSKKDIRVVYNGMSSDYSAIPNDKSDNQKKPFFLFVGSRVTYKNFNFVVNCIAQSNDFHLKIVGSKLNSNEIHLLNTQLGNRWEVYENINNTELNILYNNAFSLIYPSSYEGFGIPLLEAMKSGCPFIALNASSIPEVAGNAGVLLENLSINEFNKAAILISKDRINIINKGFEQANKFSWDICYGEILKIYKELN